MTEEVIAIGEGVGRTMTHRLIFLFVAFQQQGATAFSHILATTGMDKGALFTATAIASAIATFLLAFMAKLPFAQAPSMGLNAFFAFTLCQAMGLTWQQALAVLLVEGIIFLAITFLNIRDKILECIPKNLRFAISAGIGMFIAFIGLKNAGIITANADTFVQLGKFTPVSILGLISILLCGCLMARRVKGSLFIAIIISTLIGIPMGVTQFSDNWMPVSTASSPWISMPTRFRASLMFL